MIVVIKHETRRNTVADHRAMLATKTKIFDSEAALQSC